MKKRKALILAGLTVLLLVGCGSDAQEQQEKKTNLSESSANQKEIDEEIDGATVVIHSMEIDLRGLMNEWMDATTREDAEWLTDNATLMFERFKEEKMKLASTYGQGRYLVPLSNFSSQDDFDGNYDYITIDYRNRDDLYFISLASGEGENGKKGWESQWPGGLSSDMKMEKVTASSVYWPVRTLISFSDLYGTQEDLVSGFGKSYLAIYLDGKWVDIASYEDSYLEMMKGDLESASAQDMGRLEMGLSYYLNTTPLKVMWMIENESYHPVTEETGELLKKDALAGMAIMDCIDRLRDTSAEELLVIRVDNRTQPNKENKAADYYSCVYVRNIKSFFLNK